MFKVYFLLMMTMDNPFVFQYFSGTPKNKSCDWHMGRLKVSVGIIENLHLKSFCEFLTYNYSQRWFGKLKTFKDTDLKGF